MPDIHISDVQTFKSCRRKWDYTSRLRRGLEPKRLQEPFFVGRAVHAALEAYHSHTGAERAFAAMHSIDAYLALTIEEQKALGLWGTPATADVQEHVDLVKAMMVTYDVWSTTYDGEYKDADLEFVSLETPFQIPFRRPEVPNARRDIQLGGRFDGIVRHIPTNTLWVWECKTTRAFEGFEDYLDRSEQAAMYVIAAQYQLKQPVEGVLYNIMRKKAMPTIKVLKDGSLSKAKAVDIPYREYIRQAREHHGVVDYNEELGKYANGQTHEEHKAHFEREYGEIIEHLMMTDHQYVKRVPIVLTPGARKSFLNELWSVANEMVSTTTPAYRSESQWNCRGCSFKGPCMVAKDDPAEEAQQLSAFYQPRQYETHMLGGLEVTDL